MDNLGEVILYESMTKGGTTRNSRNHAGIDDPIYMKMIEKTTYFLIYRQKLMELVMTMFQWNNLPNSMNDYNLEHTLHYVGKAVVAKHKDTGELCNFKLSGSRGQLDIYGEPLIFDVVAHNYNDKVDRSKAVIIYNNRVRRNSFRVVNNIAFKLAESDLVISQNLNAQSSPVLITGPEAKKKDIMAIYQMRNNFSAAVVGHKSLAEDVEVKVMKTDVPYIVDKIDVHKHEIWNEGMTFLGIDNANQLKKERMITDEVGANDGQINLFMQSQLAEREKAAREINEMFGTNITVEYNDGPMDELMEMMAMARIRVEETQADLNEAQTIAALREPEQAVKSEKEVK